MNEKAKDGTERFQPVGHCIYCGSTRWSSDTERRLGDEHIIPFALGGKLLLPDASCHSCEQKTSRVELAILRGMYHVGRHHLGLPSRREKPTKFQLTLGEGSSARRVEVDADKYPGLIVTFTFQAPDILLGFDPISKKMTGGIAIGNLPTVGNINDYLPGRVSIDAPRRDADPTNLARLLAKIAHSYAVAKLGYDGFEPFLRALILGYDDDRAAFYVGGTYNEIPDPIEDINRIKLDTTADANGRALIVCRIRLFANIRGMPEYHVIVGAPNAKTALE